MLLPREFRAPRGGYETIMINCNPETVSTDYDTSDRLYFEPLTAEDVLEILDVERSAGRLRGAIVQFGGQTPLKLAAALEQAEIPILGTSVDSIDLAEDRDRFKRLLDKLGAETADERHCLFGRAIASRCDRPRPAARCAAVLCARRTCHGDHSGCYDIRRLSARYAAGPRAVGYQGALSQRQDRARSTLCSAKIRCSYDRYLSDAVEIDVDALCDGKDVFICGIMEHIEEAGIHSGDSACSLPPRLARAGHDCTP